MEPSLRDHSLSRWYVASTYPHAEERARAAVVAAGFGAYLPHRRVETVHRRTRGWRTHVLLVFPGYLFVEFPETGREEFYRAGERPSWHRLNCCRGIEHVLGAANSEGEGAPIAVPSRLVEAIMAAELNLEFDETRQARRRHERSLIERFPVGATAAVTSGPLAELSGEIARVTSSGRVELLIALMGRLVNVEVEPQGIALCPVGAPAPPRQPLREVEVFSPRGKAA
jgi:transcription antitermination factor NusG